MKKILSLTFIMIITISFLSGCDLSSTLRPDTEYTYNYYNNYIIAHAGGGIDNKTYLNVEESIGIHYAGGTRLFEYDFMFSSDNELVGVHYWSDLGEEYNNSNKMSLAQYENTKIKGLYTGMTFKNLLYIMRDEYTDISIIIDTKEGNKTSVYQKIVEDALEIDETLLDRIIPQLYNEKMYKTLENIHSFKSYVYTLYLTNSTNEEIYDFLTKTEKIRILAMFENRSLSMSAEYIQSVTELNVRIFAHTINSYDKMAELRARGILGFYTDFVFENDYSEKYLVDSIIG